MSAERIVTPSTTIFTDRPAPTWQTAMRCAIRDARELCRQLRIETHLLPTEAELELFPTFVPWEFLARMTAGDPEDPLLLQVLPQKAEFRFQANTRDDAVGDRAGLTSAGLIQKYRGRALLVVHGQCAAHCRYCFRRHFPYENSGPAEWNTAMRQLDQRGDVDELILSGGDPLTVSDQKLSSLVRSAEAISSLRRLRIHTRLPILIPQRVTSSLIDLVRTSRLRVWLVIHTNHPQEIDHFVAQAITELRLAGIPVLNQAVLLRKVNDDVETLAELSRRLIDLGVVPYYLHQLDRVTGAAHFEVPEQHGRTLVRQLRNRLPGYAVPRYVADRPGSPCKTVLL